MAIGMAISVLVETLLPGGASEVGGNPPRPKDKKGLKEWIRSKLKTLALLPGKLGMKAAEALPGIIGGIISWVFNRAKDVVAITVLMGSGCSHWRLNLYIYGNQIIILWLVI